MEPYQLDGTYGLAGQADPSKNINQLIRAKSYCAGYRDTEYEFSRSKEVIQTNEKFHYFLDYDGDVPGVMDGIIHIPGAPPAKFTSVVFFDPYAGDKLLVTGYSTNVPGYITAQLISLNGYPIYMDLPSITVEEQPYDPYGEENPSNATAYVSLDKFEETTDISITGMLTVINLQHNKEYRVRFRKPGTSTYYPSPNPILDDTFSGGNETVLIPLSFKKSDYMENGEFELIIQPHLTTTDIVA